MGSMLLMAAAHGGTLLAMGGNFLNHIVTGFASAPDAMTNIAGLFSGAAGTALPMPADLGMSGAALPPTIAPDFSAVAPPPAPPAIPEGCHMMGGKLMSNATMRPCLAG